MIRRGHLPAERAGANRSMFEFVVGGIVLALVVGVLLQRLQDYRQAAERAAVERTVGILRAALSLKVGQLVAQGREGELEALARENPMTWLTRPPPEYAGEFFSPSVGAVPPGHWYFDRKQHLLIYLLNSSEIFPHGISSSRKYAVKLLRRNNDFNRPSSATLALLP